MSDQTLAMLQEFGDAWNRHDLAALMAHMTDDCEFWASAGPEVVGARSVGREAVAAAYREVFDTFPDARWNGARITMLGDDRAMSEWTFVGTTREGRRVEVLGLDLLDLVGGKIRIKNSFRKNRTA
jgi:ketosteroid isomerase-like protein